MYLCGLLKYIKENGFICCNNVKNMVKLKVICKSKETFA